MVAGLGFYFHAHFQIVTHSQFNGDRISHLVEQVALQIGVLWLHCT